ncbi:MAG: helix-turn-helix transcriptional regulator [Clostridia bacterium]|nr:helix-turn-helix transcriptional regulator [Clostridia bacterium]
MVAERIKFLRESNGFTQSDLARQLGITRSSVNAWEQGISVPSTQYVVELARLFNVSVDYLLGVDASANLNIAGLNEDDVKLLYQIVNHLRKNNSKK